MNAARLFAALAEVERRGLLARGDGMIAAAILSGVAVWPEEVEEEDVRDARAILSRATGRNDALAERSQRLTEAAYRFEWRANARIIRATTRVGAR